MIMNSKNQQVIFEGVSLTVKREDQLHPEISGNKYRKLKYNIQEAKEQQKEILVTFGGAYSNHIAATAAAGKEYGFKTIGIIRGEELSNKIVKNVTLRYAQSCGMQLEFISRENYRKKESAIFLEELQNRLGDFYLIPEGGTNDLAIKGCEEILTENDVEFDYICTCVGTGGTVAGLINSATTKQKVIGFSVLKGDFLKGEIQKYTSKNNWELITDYHFGGYGKIKPELITFINQFKVNTNIALDPIYTGKMMYGIVALHAQGYFREDAKILVIHTGGLQGIEGMNNKLKQKGLPIIE
jgi:1-aminocyclopropane-1-carboxylate deaminase